MAKAKAKRLVYHVLPQTKGGWDVKLEGKKAVESNHSTKQKAIVAGRKLAKRPALGQLKIHKLDGRIQTEYTYGADPSRTPG